MAERQKYIVLKSEEEKIASIIAAEGEAESAQLINKAVSQNGSTLIEIRRYEAAKSIATEIAKNQNISYLPGGSTGNLINIRT